MRLSAVLLLLALIPAAAHAAGIKCPRGTIANGTKTAEATEAWCELKTDRSQYHGPYRAWYPNGVLGISERYNHGKLDGKAEYHWNNGKIKANGKYRHGLREGNWIFVEKNGVSAGIVVYRKGKLVSGYEPAWAKE